MMDSKSATGESKRGNSWAVVWALAGVAVAVVWMLIDYVLAPGAGQSPRHSLDFAVAMDYARIFFWPSSLVALYSPGSLSALPIFLGAALNAATFVAFGWLVRLCGARNKWALAIPAGLLAGWLAVVLQL